jgi:hypothetical protein
MFSSPRTTVADPDAARRGKRSSRKPVEFLR